jgi:RNA polymerase sigma-70 factor (sigma-E family)
VDASLAGVAVTEQTPDDESFDAFVAARAAVLVRVARGLLRDPQHAEDVVQDVLVKVHQHWDRILRQDSPDAYVRRMLVNASISFWRRAARREISFGRHDLLDAVSPDVTGGLDERDVMLALLRRLPPKQRAVLVLRHYEGLADDEIAAVVGCAVTTVRSNIHRGLASLRRMLAEAGPPPYPSGPTTHRHVIDSREVRP